MLIVCINHVPLRELKPTMLPTPVLRRLLVCINHVPLRELKLVEGALVARPPKKGLYQPCPA